MRGEKVCHIHFNSDEIVLCHALRCNILHSYTEVPHLLCRRDGIHGSVSTAHLSYTEDASGPLAPRRYPRGHHHLSQGVLALAVLMLKSLKAEVLGLSLGDG